MKKKTHTPWEGVPPDFHPEDWAGFVYLIEDVFSHRKYIGKKFLSSRLRKKVAGQKRRKLTVKESDWRHYQSSSDELKEAIATLGLGNFKFKILAFYKTRAEVNYAETKEHFLREVLSSRLPSGEYEYFNSNILGRYFRKRT